VNHFNTTEGTSSEKRARNRLVKKGIGGIAFLNVRIDMSSQWGGKRGGVWERGIFLRYPKGEKYKGQPMT